MSLLAGPSHRHPRQPDVLPRPRGPLSEGLFGRLGGPPDDVSDLLPAAVVAGFEDLHLALYCCYELHYGGLPGVDPEWEWEPSLLAVRQELERSFEAELFELSGPPPEADPDEVVPDLWRLAGHPDDGRAHGPSLSAWVAEKAELWQVKELAVHRSAYQLKEADPHTWAIPRVPGRAKAVMVAIQTDEYGDGDPERMHSALFATTMAHLGLDTTPNGYLDCIPGVTLATTNLISLFGLHRRWRGALVGHLALFEMTSVGPMGRYSAALRRLGLPAAARRFYDVHVEADEVHQDLAADGMVAGLMGDDPALAGDVLFGAAALAAVEARLAAHVLTSWEAGETSLLAG